MNASLHDRRVLITGASQGLGRVCAEALARDGARLALVSRSQERLERVRRGCDHPERHCTIAADLTRMEEAAAAAAQAQERLGPVEIIIHTAGGGLGLRDPLLPAGDFLTLLNLNLLSVHEINRLLIPSMREQGFGRLVHIGSVASAEATGSVGYNTAKAALAAYVRTLGRELAREGDLVATGILPGGFTAPDNAMVRLQANKPEVYRQFIDQRLPRGHMGEAGELMPMIRLLCSAGATMMGGCMVPIDAGEGLAYPHSPE